MRKVDERLLPEGEAPVPAPLRLETVMRPPAVSEASAPVTTVKLEPEADWLPVVEDDAGRTEVIEGRTVSEAMFFRFGMEGAGVGEIAEWLRASMMWVSGVMGREGWLREAYDRGLAERDKERVRRGERALDRLIDGEVLEESVVGPAGEVVKRKQVGPAVGAVVKLLETRARDRYGKDAAPAPRAVAVQVILGANQRLAEAGEVQVTVQGVQQ